MRVAGCRSSLMVIVVLASAAGRTALAQYDAPAGYYVGVENLSDAQKPKGDQLKSTLRTLTAIPTGQKQNYGNARYSAAYTDVDPNNPANILTVYSRRSVPATWDGGATWNREHLWPQSRIGASASNGTANIASDQFELRPAASNENSSRGNRSYGGTYGSGAAGNIGSYFYPGDIEAGDVARAAFYMATQYTTIRLVNGAGNPDNNEMGDLAALVTYHYADVPDTFERRRNHAIYGGAGVNSPAINNPYAQGNRNPYVDHPEYVWSAFVDQANDTRLRIGTADANGGSTAVVDFGRVIKGSSAALSTKALTITKEGVDGTYFSVTPSAGATSSITGRYNAFAVGTTGSKTLTVGMSASTATVGVKTETITIDNLDITTGGGAGRGANDGNDVATLQLKVLNPANPGFGSGDANNLLLNFGTVSLGSTTAAIEFSLNNIVSAAGAELTAGLDLDSFSMSVTGGGPNQFTTDLATFKNLLAGGEKDFSALFKTDMAGTFTTTYQLRFSDEDLPGAGATTVLNLALRGTVVVPEPGMVGLLVPVAMLIVSRRR